MSPEYQKYIKEITDRFISMLEDDGMPYPQYKEMANGEFVFGEFISINTVPKFPNSPEVIERTYQEKKRKLSKVELAWIKEKNRRAIEFLKQNIISFEDWKKKQSLIQKSPDEASQKV